jgi:hypothetical protein
MYVTVRICKSHDRSVHLSATFRWVRRTGKLHLYLTVIQRW